MRTYALENRIHGQSTSKQQSIWKMVFTAGMGFFTDAYDLFVIGVVTAILAPIWHLTSTQLAVMNGASLAAAAIGALLFGRLADKFGRKKMYGFEVLILFFGAIWSACAWSYTSLLLARIVVGFGIGGDYPSSAVVVSEHSGDDNRGFFVLLVFAMQAVGLIVGPLLAVGLLSLHIDHHIVWRVLLGIGAIPAASVFYLRRMIRESRHYLKAQETPAVEVSRVVSHLSGYKDSIAVRLKGEKKGQFKHHSMFSRRWWKLLLATAGSWFLLDVAFYGNGVSSVMILDILHPHSTLSIKILLTALIFLCFAVPGYAFAAKYVDRIGRRRLQGIGFAVIALCYIGIGLIPDLKANFIPFMALFGLSFFFTNFGPNTTTFLIPSEIYPAKIRASAHGFSAAIGKVGAFVGAFSLPLLLHRYGVSAVMDFLAVLCILGCLLTLLLPEMKGRGLEETEVDYAKHLSEKARR